MSEMLLYTERPGILPRPGGYAEGDIIAAYNNRRIKQIHTDLICHPRWSPTNGDGLRDESSVSCKRLDSTYRWRSRVVTGNKWERTETDYLGNVLAVEVFDAFGFVVDAGGTVHELGAGYQTGKFYERIAAFLLDQFPGQQISGIEFGAMITREPRKIRALKFKLNGSYVPGWKVYPETIDPANFVRARKKHADKSTGEARHRVFGTAGAEVYHGGRQDLSVAAVNHAWTIVEANSDHEGSAGPCAHCTQDHTVVLPGTRELRRFVQIDVDDFNETEAAALVAPHKLTFEPGDTITDPDGATVVPSWSDENLWEHPTGKWIYQRDAETNAVEVTFSKRNLQVDDFDTKVPDVISKTRSQIDDYEHMIGRAQSIPDPAKTPWMRGRNRVEMVIDHPRFNDEKMLKNRRDNRRGERLPE